MISAIRQPEPPFFFFLFPWTGGLSKLSSSSSHSESDTLSRTGCFCGCAFCPAARCAACCASSSSCALRNSSNAFSCAAEFLRLRGALTSFFCSSKSYTSFQTMSSPIIQDISHFLNPISGKNGKLADFLSARRLPSPRISCIRTRHARSPP